MNELPCGHFPMLTNVGLRDMFAAAVAGEILAIIKQDKGPADPDVFASRCYLLADAMMKARDARSPSESTEKG
jgi:hypothetical protein